MERNIGSHWGDRHGAFRLVEAAIGRLADYPAVLMVLRTGVLLAIYKAVEFWLMTAGELPAESYQSGAIAFAFGRRLLAEPWGLLALAALLGIGYRRVWAPWTSFEGGAWVRVAVTLAAALLAWPYATSDYNLFFNQAYYGDRVALLVLVGLIYWRPVFAWPFLFVVVPMVWQFFHPTGWYSWAEEYLMVRLVMLWCAAFVLFLLGRSFSLADFVFVGACLMAGHYWGPGYAKLRMGWVSHGHIYLLMFATYANGWLAWLEPESLVRLAKGLSHIDWLMRLWTVLAEWAVLLFLWNRRTMLAFPIIWISFHLGIFFVSGIFFWKWIILDAVLVAFLWNGARGRELDIFTRPRFLLSVLLIGTGTLWIKPIKLAWYDTPLSYTYTFEAVGSDGARYRVAPYYFRPYDFMFTLARFTYLVDEPRLGIVMGATSKRVVAEGLLRASSPDQVFELENELGANGFNGAAAERLDDFIRAFFANLNQRGSKETALSWLSPPQQVWTLAQAGDYDGQAKVTAVVVSETTGFFDGDQYRQIRTQEIRRIEIPQG